MPIVIYGLKAVGWQTEGNGVHMNDIKWNDRFNIGVEKIDSAHRRLFSIVGKLLDLAEDSEKQKHACQEGIKYLKSYTQRHFAEEEAYMRLIDYKDYAIHKSLHDNMQNVTVPALEQEMESQDYSGESMQHFLGICVGWLNGHIMIEDRAITGKTPHKWIHQPTDDELDSLEKAVIQTFHDLLRLDMDIVSKHYGGEDFASGRVLCFRISYRMPDKKTAQVFLVYEEQMILNLINDMVGKQIKKLDKTILEAMRIISLKFMQCMETHFSLGDDYKYEKINVLSFEQLIHSFEKQYPPYSLLFCTEKNNYFALCINK